MEEATREEAERKRLERQKTDANFDQCVRFLNQKGKERFGENFAIHPPDYEIIYKLLVYFLSDRASADKLGLSLGKGLLLTGPIGCGKTSLLTLLNQMAPLGRRYVMRTCREVGYAFIKDGYDALLPYSSPCLNRSGNERPIQAFCFDDLGTENSLKYYGNECNVMAEVLLGRHELFVHRKILTHLTTNLSAGEIESLYGPRVRSRMREMFNLVAFDKSCPDKRK